MVDRKIIGLNYSYNENWIGGTYYIENLVNALNSIEDSLKPTIVLLSENYEAYETARQRFNYPYLSFRLKSGEANKAFQFLNRILFRLFKIRLFNQKLKGLDAVFPYYRSIQQSAAQKKVYWIADFQEHFAPEFFTSEEIQARGLSQREVAESSEHLILSSKTALGHFKTFYPDHRVKVQVLPFAVSHPPYQDISIISLLEKYLLPNRYFICPNQFWKHKNHLVILQAVKELKSKGFEISVVFTGSTSDYRNPHYFNELKDFVKESGIKENIKFLGFIDRRDQLQLMNNALAIIQPSLFEGWSTVVEDAKRMNRFLLVSDIEIHREQLLNSSAVFFDPLDAVQLAEFLEHADKNKFPEKLFENNTYQESIKNFGISFIEMLS